MNYIRTYLNGIHYRRRTPRTHKPTSSYSGNHLTPDGVTEERSRVTLNAENCSSDGGRGEFDSKEPRFNDTGSNNSDDHCNTDSDCFNSDSNCSNGGCDHGDDVNDYSNGDNDGSDDYGDYDNTGSDDGSDDLGHGDGNCSSEEHCDINKNEDDEVQFDSMMFQPIYDNASISLCAALRAIMVFKSSHNLSFSCIGSLLQHLQLLCPVGNKLPHSVYSIKKFLKMFSSTSIKHHYCSSCEEELCDRQQKCNKVTCKYFEPNTLIRFDAINSIKRIMASK